MWKTPVKFYDIGVNLTDHMFQGIYHGKKYHDSDLVHVLYRCKESNVRNLLLTGSSIEESKLAIKLSNQYSHEIYPKLYYTIGVHPCCVNEFVLKDVKSTIDNPSLDEKFNQSLTVNDIGFTKNKLQELYRLISDSVRDVKFRAIGEIGLDYDRFYYSGEQIQIEFFIEQLKLSCLFPDLPLFLHMRNCGPTFLRILNKFINGWIDNEDKFDWRSIIDKNNHDSDYLKIMDDGIFYRFSPNRKFVVHSFTDTNIDLENLLSSSPNCYIGINGCSLKSKENIENVRKIPIDRLLLETDSPWCDIRKTHESYKFMISNESDFKIAYPNHKEWYQSVKRERLCRKEVSELDGTMVKTRNEPCTMGYVAIIVANVKNIPLQDVIEHTWNNSCKVYGE